jgi:hypothetical protein
LVFRPGAFIVYVSPVLSWARLPSQLSYRPQRSRNLLQSFIAFLLIPVEANPGPSSIKSGITFGSWNVRGANHKGANIIDIIQDNRFAALAICETWILEDTPAAVKLVMAPPDYVVRHVHRHTGHKGGGLALISSAELAASVLTVNTAHTAFDVQLVSIRVGRTTMLIANIYRPPLSSKAIFSDEFAELLVLNGLHHNNRLVICDDFNLPGDSQCTCDDSLTALLDTLGYQQMVTSPTRHDPATVKDNILDLLITHHPLSQQPLVSNVQILDSHDLSGHSVVACELSTRRFKAPATKCSYRPIHNVDPIMFESKLRDADVFVNPAKSVDEMVRQLEEAVTGILNELAPVRVGHRPQ